jgi:PAS domain S-box-containing protein
MTAIRDQHDQHPPGLAPADQHLTGLAPADQHLTGLAPADQHPPGLAPAEPDPIAKGDAVLALLAGTPAEALAARLGVSVALLLHWREEFIEAGRARLANQLPKPQHWQALLAATPNLLLRMNSHGDYLDVLRRPAQFQQAITEQNLIGHNIREYLPPETVERELNYFRQALEQQELQAYEYQFEVKGQTYHRLARVVPASADEVLVSVEDIGQRKEAEAESAHRQAQYQDLVRASNAIVLRWTPDGTIAFINEYGAGLFGFEVTELVGRSIFDTIASEKAAAKTGTTLTDGVLHLDSYFYRFFDNVNVRKDGSTIWITWSNRPIFSQSGELIEILAIGQDASQRKAAEFELERSNALLQAQINSTPDGMLVIGPNREILGYNRRFLEIWDIPEAAVPKVPTPGWILPYVANPEDFTERTRYLYDHPELTGRDDIYLRDGRIVDRFSGPVASEHQFFGRIWHYRDVTEERQQVRALRDSEARVRTLLEAIPDLTVRIDYHGNYLEVVKMPSDYVIGRERFINKHVRDVLPEQVAPIIVENIQYTIDHNVARNVEFELLFTGNGPARKLYREMRISPIGNNEVLALVRDITERKAAEVALAASEDALRRSNAILSAQLEAAPDGVIVVDEDGNVINYNRHYLEVWDLPKGIIESSTSREVILEVAQRAQEPQQFITRFMEIYNNRASPSRDEIALKDGRFIDRRSGPVMADGRYYGRVLYSRDITEEKRFEETLKHAKNVAESANRSKSTFLANMSHELRTPLNAILGFAQVLARDTLTGEQREQVNIINRSGEHLLSLINDVLEMSKIEAGRVSLNESAVDLHHLLENLVEMLSIRARSKHITLDYDQASNLPHYIQADEGKLRQVLINLLGNAVKFTDNGGVRLRAALGSDRLRFIIEDTGPGIAADEMDKLFDPFVQTDAGKKSQEGTGLGLPISKQFARLMGGDIQVTSTVGRGSAFSFEMNFKAAEISDEPAPQAREVIRLLPEQEVLVLVVDDKWENRMLLQKLLSKVGFVVLEAEDGAKAVAVWRERQPTLVLMDMRMPIMDGYQATRIIRQQASANNLKPTIIAVTASAFEEQKAEVLEAGCDDFIAKPFRDNDLLERIGQHLGLRYEYREQQEQSRKVLVASDFQGLEAALRGALYNAATAGDDEACLELLRQISASGNSANGSNGGNTPVNELVEYLRRLVLDYQFREVRKLVSETA